MIFSQEQINKAYFNTPENVKNILNSDRVLGEIKEIAGKHSLRVDKTQLLIDGVVYVTLGLLPISDFVEFIEEHLEKDREKSIEIAKEVDIVVFQRIREKIILPEDQDLLSENQARSLQEKKEMFNQLNSGDEIPDEIFQKKEEIPFSERLNTPVEAPLKKNDDPYRESID